MSEAMHITLVPESNGASTADQPDCAPDLTKFEGGYGHACVKRWDHPSCPSPRGRLRAQFSISGIEFTLGEAIIRRYRTSK